MLVFIGGGCPPTAPTPESEETTQPPAETIYQMHVLDAAGNLVPGNMVMKQHRIGQSTCPDQYPPMTIEFPAGFEGAQIAPTTNVSWLNLPDTITSGKPFEMEFNCHITNFATHREQAQIIIDFAKYVQEHPGMEHTGGVPQAGTFIVVVDACKGECPEEMPTPEVTPALAP